MHPETTITLHPGDALIIVDVQNDFLPGGALAVPRGDEVVPALNHYIAKFSANKLPIFATRDWHPRNHCSFRAQGGPWPPHCVAESTGAGFAPTLRITPEVIVISKAMGAEQDAYSGFGGTDLAPRLRALNVTRVFVGGLATDYCVLNTVLDGLKHGFETVLLTDAIRAVNVHQDDGTKAEETMRRAGVQAATQANFH
jgi:nicotinamidase/pyrazinamidase